MHAYAAPSGYFSPQARQVRWVAGPKSSAVAVVTATPRSLIFPGAARRWDGRSTWTEPGLVAGASAGRVPATPLPMSASLPCGANCSGSPDAGRRGHVRAAHRVRSAANWVNLSTPAGLLLARVARRTAPSGAQRDVAGPRVPPARPAGSGVHPRQRRVPARRAARGWAATRWARCRGGCSTMRSATSPSTHGAAGSSCRWRTWRRPGGRGCGPVTSRPATSSSVGRGWPTAATGNDPCVRCLATASGWWRSPVRVRNMSDTCRQNARFQLDPGVPCGPPGPRRAPTPLTQGVRTWTTTATACSEGSSGSSG